MLQKVFLQGFENKDKGMTLVEMIVAMTVSLIVLSLAMSILSSNRQLYAEDQKVNDTTQNLRIATDIVGIDAKKAGEGITENNFPVVDIKQDARNNSELKLRLKFAAKIPAPNTNDPHREFPGLELNVLPVCDGIGINPTRNDDGTVSDLTDPDGNPAITTVSDISVAKTPAPSEVAQCNPTDGDSNYVSEYIANPNATRTKVTNNIPDNWENWRDYRCWQDGVQGCQGNAREKARAFIHDGQGKGQFIIYESEDCLDASNVSKLPNCVGATNYTIRKQYDSTKPDGGYLVNDYGFARNPSNTSKVLVNKASSEIHLLVEERKYSVIYKVVDDIEKSFLRLQVDNEEAQDIIDEIDKFKIQASVINDGNDIQPKLIDVFPVLNPNDPPNSYTWKNLRGIKFYLKSKDPLGNSSDNTDYQKRLESTEMFLPRNTASCRFPC